MDQVDRAEAPSGAGGRHAGRALIGLVWPALVVALLTVALGRFFCVGCGICETKCPLTDRAAVLVTSRGETRSTVVLAR